MCRALGAGAAAVVSMTLMACYGIGPVPPLEQPLPCASDGDCLALGPGSFCNRDMLSCASGPREICDDGIDNDGDGRVDCDDLDCQAACRTCGAPLETPKPPAQPVTMGDTRGGAPVFHEAACLDSAGLEQVYLYQSDAASPAGVLTITLDSATSQGLYAFTGPCLRPGAERACVPPRVGHGSGALTLAAGEPVFVAVFSEAPTTAGPYTISFAFAPSVCGDGERTADESCDDGNLVAGDGCDPSCEPEPAYFCANAVALADGPNQATLSGQSNAFSGACGGSGQSERVFVYTPPADGSLYLTLASEVAASLYVRTECESPTAELACTNLAAGAPQAIDVRGTAGTPLYVFVDGDPQADAPAGFTLAANFAPD